MPTPTKQHITTPTRPSNAGVIAQVTPRTPITTEERFLYAALSWGCTAPYKNDLWHLMTSMPINFPSLYQDLASDILNVKALLFTTRSPISDAVYVLFEKGKLYNLLLASSGVYYAMLHRGDPATHTKFAPHIAGTIFFEKINGAIRGRDHVTKGADLRRGLQDVIIKLTALHAYIATNKTEHSAFLPRISAFIEYLNLHARCLDIALAYNHDVAKNHLDFTSVPTAVSACVAMWHPGPLKLRTPVHPTPSVQLLQDAHAQVSTREAKSPRLAAERASGVNRKLTF